MATPSSLLIGQLFLHLLFAPFFTFSFSSPSLLSMSGPTLIPPFRFAHVEEDLFRSGYPTPLNFRFLKRLRLRTIVSVVPTKPTDELAQFCTLQGIKSVHIKVEKYKEKNPLTNAAVVQALEVQ